MSTMTTMETIVGVFASRQEAERAMRELYDAGFQSNQIGYVARDSSKKNVVGRKGENSNAEESAGAGAITGAAVGAAGGAAIGAGIATGLIPVIGPVLAIGTLGTILLNAAGGAAAAGLTGALIGWGVSDEDASYYESEVTAGRHLVTVQAAHRLDVARDILRRNDGLVRD